MTTRGERDGRTNSELTSLLSNAAGLRFIKLMGNQIRRGYACDLTEGGKSGSEAGQNYMPDPCQLVGKDYIIHASHVNLSSRCSSGMCRIVLRKSNVNTGSAISVMVSRNDCCCLVSTLVRCWWWNHFCCFLARQHGHYTAPHSPRAP